MGIDNRFMRRKYLFYALSAFEKERVKSNISVFGKRIRKGNGVDLIDNLHLHMQNLRGTGAYWFQDLQELLAMMKQLGYPTFFLTFSCNDLNWLDMRKALLNADGRPDADQGSLSKEEVRQLVERHPITVARQFMVRIQALLRLLKNDDNVHGGKLIDYWYRIEIQNRGSPYLHMVTWH